MKIQFSDRAKQSLQGGQGRQKECSPHDGSREAFNELLQEVGAKTRMKDRRPVLRFVPPLESTEINSDRWAMAKVLEGLFWQICKEYGY